ncbi:MAG: hypothetical protein UH241_05190 [Acutalibacteraceae bacterium]|nr:hypothetical protein [Acutalibacteraceae bacterium]
MAKKENKKIHLSSRITNIIYTIVSFILSLLLLLCSVSVVLSSTVFSKEHMINTMNSTRFYSSVCSEIKVSLTDLGYASGLDESFFENLLDVDMIEHDMFNYLQGFYSGTSSVVITDNFKEHSNEALDQYIKEKNIPPQSVNAESRKYLVINAAKRYKAALELPFFSYIAGNFIRIKNILPIVIAVLAVLSVLVIVILMFSTKWKHRPIKFICYSTTSVFLVTILPVILAYGTKKFEQLNIDSRAMYNIFVEFGYNTVNVLMYGSIFFAIVSLVLYIIYRKVYPKRATIE